MRYKEIKPLAEQTLFEINMSPSSLKQLASKINARAGLEFEMLVPNTNGEGEPEPDYDADEGVRDIQDIFDFFNDDNYNTRRQVESLRDTLYEEYYDWQSEKLSDLWDGSEGHDFIEDWLRDNGDPSDWESDERYLNSEERFNEIVDFVQTGDSRYYDAAREAFDDEYRDSYTERNWLDARGLHYMSEIADRFRITWPHWTTGGEGTSIRDIADSFDGYLGRGVKTGEYHKVSRNTTGYIVEPDGSLEPDSGDAGLEFVSPPLSIPDMIEDLHKVVTWADDYGCYTNESCGLHMNVSVENFDKDSIDYIKLAVLCGDEYVQGQFGREFGTKAHDYCKSAIGKIRDSVAKDPVSAKAVLEKMKSHLEQGAKNDVNATTRRVHDNHTSKYTSLNLQNNRVEFRSPGGDWLNEYRKDPGKLINTLLRFVVALDAAMDPTKYRQEYLKKLYKLLNPKGLQDEYGEMVEQFAKYVTGVGGAPEQVVKDFRRVALQAIRKPSQSAVRSKYELYRLIDGEAVIGGDWRPVRFDASSQQDAEQRMRKIVQTYNLGALELFGVRRLDRPQDRSTPSLDLEVYDREDPERTTVTVVHGNEAQCETMIRNFANRSGIPRTRLAVRPVGHTATGPSSRQMFATNGVPLWQIVRRSNGEVVHEFENHTQAGAQERGGVFLRSQPGFGEPGNGADDFTIIPKTSDAPVEYRWPRLSGNRQEWILTGNGQEVSRFQASSREDAEARAREWLPQQDEHWRAVNRPFQVRPA